MGHHRNPDPPHAPCRAAILPDSRAAAPQPLLAQVSAFGPRLARHMSAWSQPSPDAMPKAALDPQALARLRELDPDASRDVVARVLSAFENSLTRLLAQLQDQRQAGQADVVAGVAHTLKSSAASVGARELSRACAEVELRLRGRDPATLQQDISRLISEGQSAMAAVAAILRP